MKFLLSILLLLIATQVFSQSADEIIKKADDIRNPPNGYQMTITLTSNDQETKTFDVITKGKDKTLIKTLLPLREKNKNYLMINENMWAYIPNIKRSVRISLMQKLDGEASNGDIGRMYWSGDYTAKIQAEDKKTWKLYLVANKKGLTYEKLNVTVEKKTFYPLFAEYLSLSDLPLKKASFEDYKMIAGAIRPTKITITNAKSSKSQTVLIIKELTEKSFSDSEFTQARLGE